MGETLKWSYIPMDWVTIYWKRISPFPYLGLYKCMQNYPRPLDPMQWKQKKKHNFTILGSRGKPLEIWMFPNQFCLEKMKNNESKSLIYPRSFA